VTPHPADDELLRMATDMSPTGILAVGPDGTILLANQEIERLFGWPRTELVGQRIEVLLPMRMRGGHNALREGFARNPSQRSMGAGRDLRGVRRDGTEFPVEVGLRPVQMAQGMVTFATVLDVTARLELEKASRQSQKLESLGTLAGGVAHEFNNILSNIVGHTELTRLNHGDTETRDLEQVMNAAERGRQLVQRILWFSHGRDVERAPVDLPRIVREASTLVRASTPSNIELRLELDPETPFVVCDEIELHMVVINLCSNARQAMPDGGVLTVNLDRFLPGETWRTRHGGLPEGPLTRLRVSDTGMGMPPDVLERIFEPFFTTKPIGQGTGLGLSMVHGIVRELGGVIEVDSREGHGTRFTLVFPSAPVAAQAAAVAPTAATAGLAQGSTPRSAAAPTGSAARAARSAATASPRQAGGRAPARILLVEDEDTLGRMQKRLLESMGYEVTLHLVSPEALEDFQSRPDAFDMLVTDNTMPRMSGLHLTAEVHKVRPDLPVLMISGLVDRADEDELRALGIDGMLRKPHTSQQLDDAIRAILDRR
jgi:PAS domain S-box-containing protein